MDWHRLFGLLLTDYFADSPFVVELEKDLSLRQQFLDVVILRKRPGRFPGRLPDGFDLAPHNLLTFKSHREALDDWTLKELTGHYVNYHKQLGAPGQPLLPEADFRLYAICSRYPHNLASAVPLEERQLGVHWCRRGTDVIRVIVVGQLPREEHNAPLHLFSGSAEQVAYGAAHYRQRSEETSTVLYQLVQHFHGKGLEMPYTMEDFKRDFVKEHFKDLTPEEKQEALRALPAEERLEGLSREEIEDYLKRVEEASPAPAAKRKGKGRRNQGRRQ
jgi:hypothetical protein